MDKNSKSKSYRISGYKENRVGTPTGLLDKNGNELLCGDHIIYEVSQKRYNLPTLYEDCVVLWNGSTNEYAAYLTSGQSKVYVIPKDNGGRMLIEKVMND